MLLASFFRACRLSFLGLGLAAAPLLAQTLSAADGFDPDVDGNVYVLATQPDGKLLIGGQFSTVRGAERANLARLNADGSLDSTFDPRPDGPVRAIVVQPDGRILIGGDFADVPAPGAIATRRGLARLNADGSVDHSLALSVGHGPLQPQVFALALQPDGAIVVGGSFSSVTPGALRVIYNRKNLFRIAPNGSLDLGFDPSPDAMVLAVAAHVQNKIVIGGAFRTLWPAGDSAPTSRNRIARLNPNGAVDSDFNPNANNGVTTLALQRDGKIVLGGFFTTLQPSGEENPITRPHLARLNLDGTVDSDFHPRAEGNVSAVALQPDGSLLVGGTFGAAWGRGSTLVTRNYLARFRPDGTLDPDFAPLVNGEVDAFAFQPDGRIVIGGYFTRVQPRGAATPLLRNHLARLNPDGSFDADFALDPGGRILTSITQADGRIVIGGTFTSVGGATHNYLARLNADGTVDPTYNPDFNGRVYTLAYDAAANKVIVGGAFSSITTTRNGAETRNNLARLNPDGTPDADFNPNLNGQVGVILLQPDGKILVGGTFTNVFPSGAAAATSRSNLLRLNANGSLDTAFDPSPNSSVSTLALQPDGKILLGGLFSALTPGLTTNTAATTTPRGYLGRLNPDGTVDTAFDPTLNAPVSAIAVQSDGKILIGGTFTSVVGSDDALVTVTNDDGTTSRVAPTRNRIARLNADGTLDAYDPNASHTVLAIALQADGKAILGGYFLTLQPNGATTGTLRKYAARLNADGTVDSAFDLDLSEQPGNRVDSIRVQPDGRLLLGGSFTSLHPRGASARTPRRNFVRLTAAGQVDLAFDPGTGGSTGAIVNGLAVQPDNKIIAVGSFADLGGAKSTNVARFLPEGAPDPDFNSALGADGPLHAVAVRPNVAPVPSQVSGFAWFDPNGALRSAFASGRARLSGEINAIAVDDSGRVLLGGSFTNLENSSANNLVRLNANGTLDASFAPNPNGRVLGLALQRDGRIVIVGSFTTVRGDVTRNRIARLAADGTVDSTFDPNANSAINTIVIEGDDRMIIGGAFTSLTPNLATAAVTRNYLARVNFDGTIDANYNPTPNFTVNALTLQSDGKVIAGGGFTTVAPNGATTPTTRNYLARFNPDGTLDQNFDPNPNAPVSALATLPNDQLVVGGRFTALQRNQSGTATTRNHLARVNSDGTLDAAFNPNPNGAVTSLALQPNGAVLVGGAFTTLQPNATGAALTRNRFARVTADGAVDPELNPEVNGTINAVLARPDGSVLVAGRFTDLQLIGSIVVGGNFASIGGLAARHLAMLNQNGSVNTTFQPRPDGAVNAILIQPDGKIVAGGAFTNIAGAARARLARFNADGTLDAGFVSDANLAPAVTALAWQKDRLLVATAGGAVYRLNPNGSLESTFPARLSLGASPAISGLAVDAQDRIYEIQFSAVARRAPDGSPDATFAWPDNLAARSLALQSDGQVVVGTDSGVVRITARGAIDSSFNAVANGRVTAVAIQSDGRVMAGGGFNSLAGAARVGIGRLSNPDLAVQALGVAANRSSVTWTRGGATGEISAVQFDLSTDRTTWTLLGAGARVAGTANWQLGGLNLPASGLFYVRARGLAATGGASSGIYESVREFTFTNPVPPLAAGPVLIAATPAAAAQLFDPMSGIALASVITVVPGEGNVEIFVASQEPTTGTRPARLANLSTRGRVSAETPLILGFAIAGSEDRRVLVRAIGPALRAFAVGDALAATRLQIFDAAGRVLATNEGWANAADVAQVSAATGAFPLTAGSADSAAVLTLAPGTYTVQVVDAAGSGGIGLAEIYDAGSGDGARLVNVSSRAAAGVGADALISGFVLAGDVAQRVLLRGVGPGLARFGATNVVADPTVVLFSAAGSELGSNDNWVSSLTTISSAATRAGAFALEPGSRDAAVLATLPAGAYTIQVRSTAGPAGNALLEVYEVR